MNEDENLIDLDKLTKDELVVLYKHLAVVTVEAIDAVNLNLSLMYEQLISLDQRIDFLKDCEIKKDGKVIFLPKGSSHD